MNIMEEYKTSIIFKSIYEMRKTQACIRQSPCPQEVYKTKGMTSSYPAKHAIGETIKGAANIKITPSVH